MVTVNPAAGEAQAGLVPAITSLRDLRKIGHITPSSNTALEAITAMMNAPLAALCSHHFARIPVTAVRLDEATPKQFAFEPMVEAAALLADAPIHALVWNGTAASWLGIAHDEELCRRITAETGLPSSTSTLAFLEAFEEIGARRIALAVPYVADLTARIGEVYATRGVEVVSEAHLGQYVNHDIGHNPLDAVRRCLREADSPDAECIAVVCTNFPATLLVEEMEAELGKPILDSIAVTFRKGCLLAGIDPRIDRWGALMRGEVAAA